jgi:hypothetical protein
MSLTETIELLHRSSSRLMELDAMDGKTKKERIWRIFLRRETWIHIKRTARLAWEVFWKGG